MDPQYFEKLDLDPERVESWIWAALMSQFKRFRGSKMDPWRAVVAHNGDVEGLYFNGRRFASL
jgi:hypothetical protein